MCSYNNHPTGHFENEVNCCILIGVQIGRLIIRRLFNHADSTRVAHINNSKNLAGILGDVDVS